MRTRVWAAALSLIVLGCDAPRALDEATDEPIRQVILITVDTLRLDHLGYAGYPRGTSPFLDRLAGEGVVFSNAVAGSSHTEPSHATMFTGLYPPQHGVVANAKGLRPDVSPIAEIFRAAGFKTAAFTSVRFLRGLARGFEVFDTPMTSPRVERYRPAPGTVDEALSWIRRQQTDESFFLWVHLFDPHEWNRGEEYIAAAEVEELRKRSHLNGGELLEYLRREHGQTPEFQTAAALRMVDNYDTQILRSDRQIERLVGGLDEAGLLPGSLIVVTADHGEGLGSHGIAGHGLYLYQEQIHVPLVFRFGNGLSAGVSVDRLVRHVDLLPTLAELTGVELLPGAVPLEGRSLVPLLAAGTRGGRGGARIAFAQRRPANPPRIRAGWEPGNVHCVIDETHKYIYHSEGQDELYDLIRDPLELTNLVGSETEAYARLSAARAALSRGMTRQASGETIERKGHLDELRALGYLD